MKRNLLMVAALAVFAVGFGMSAASAADGAAEAQQAWSDFDAKMRPIAEQMYQKRAELANLSAPGAAVDEEKVRALYREIADLQAQAYALHREYAPQMDANGYACPGYGAGAGCQFGGMGMGGGYGRGMGCGMGGGYGRRGMGMGGWGHRGGGWGGHHGGRW